MKRYPATPRILSSSVALYARVSTETQEKQQTIQSQLAELRRYAQAHGLEVAREFVDDGYSGTMLERPGLDALRDFVAAGGVETVLCLCPDRLSRNYLHLGLLLEEFDKRGVKVAFVNQQVDDTPEGKLLLQIQGAVSEYERTKILDRTRRGKRHKVEQGQLAGPIAAYGYTYIHVSRGAPSRWDINPAEAEVVRQIFAWFVAERLSIRQIARELAARAIPTRKGRAQWCTSQIHRILANEAYLGTAYYFKTYPTLPDRPREEKAYRRKPKTTNRRRDREEWVPVAVPAIIDRETYDRAQAFLQENLRFANRNNTRHQYLLRGLLRCGQCGRSYIGNGSGARTYYVCSGNNALAAGRPDRCGAGSLRTDRIEPLVWDTIRSLLDDPGLLRQYAEQQAPATHSSEDAAARRKAFERQIAQADAEEMRVVRLYREGIISEELLQAQLAEVRAKRQTIQHDLDALNQDAEAAASFATHEAAIDAFCEDIRLGLEHATFEERQEVLRLLVNHIEIDPGADTGTLHGVIPLPEDATLRPKADVPLHPRTRGISRAEGATTPFRGRESDMPQTVPQPRTVSRLEQAVVFAAVALLCLCVGLMAHAAGRADAEALAALSHALDVVRKDPRFNLALIGFARPPLPALLYLPFCAFGPALPASGLPCPILGAVCLGLSAALLNGIGADAGMRPRWRWLLCLLLVVHPIALSLGALGGPGAILIPVLIGAAGALMRWSREESFRDLLTASLLFAAAVLTRYETIWPALTAGAYIVWRTRREGWARTEGTLIAYALPLVYCAAVWVGASWAIMGSPWHFWRAQYAGQTVPVGRDDLASTLFSMSFLAFPIILGLLWEQLSRRQRDAALNGRPAAWLVIGTTAGALLMPVHDSVSGPWELFLGAVVLMLVVGFALTAVSACNWASGRRPLVTSLMLAIYGLAVVVWQPDVGGVSVSRTLLGAPQGKVAFSTEVTAEREAGRMLSALLPGARKAYILGGPGYAVSLFCGQPPRVFLRGATDIASLPLEAGDVLALHESVTPDALRSLLARKCLRAVPAGDAGGVWRLRRVESAVKSPR